MKKNNTAYNTVSFRLEPEILQPLKAASGKGNLSIHDYSKQVISDYLREEGELSKIKVRLESVEDMLRNLGIDIAIGFRQILLSEAKSSEVDPWLRRELHCSNWKRKR